MSAYQPQMSVTMSPRTSLGGVPLIAAQQQQQPQPQSNQTGQPGIGMGRGPSNTGLQNPVLNVTSNANPNHPGVAAQQMLQSQLEDSHEAHSERLLNLYIYEYLLKSGFYQAARGLISETSLQLGNSQQDSSPNQDNDHFSRRSTALKRTQSQIDHPNASPNDKPNGKSPGSMSNSPRNEPADLPSADVPVRAAGQRGFLLTWWGVFWDVFAARSSQHASQNAYAYLEAQVRLCS